MGEINMVGPLADKLLDYLTVRAFQGRKTACMKRLKKVRCV